MDGWLKGLVAAACVAVLVAVGYYFWNERAEAKMHAQKQARVDDAMSWLYRLSDAEKGDIRRIAQFCDNVRDYRPMRDSAKSLGADHACDIAGF